jgi:hypothetical protein
MGATRGKKPAGPPRGSPTTRPTRVVGHADFKANWQAKKGGYPSGEASWATKRKANHAAHQGRGTHSPQVSTALFGYTAGENQGKTGQGISAANFLPAPRKAGDPHAEAWLAWL